MKNSAVVTLFFFFGFFNCLACDCVTPTAILEFYGSKYVFRGIITEKTFSKDSATYTVKFKVLENYKKARIPKELSFTSYYKKENAKWSSCFSEEFQYQEWLVFAYENQGKLGFSKMCSNSEFVGGVGIDPYMQKILDHGKTFKIENYIFKEDYRIREEFSYTKPVTNIDSIFRSVKSKDYEKTHTVLELYIDEKGSLISVFTSLDMNHSEGEFKYDPIFGLLQHFTIKSKRPLNDFEKDAIDLFKKVNVWEIMRHKGTNVPVRHIRTVHVEFDKETNKWKYEI